MNNECKAFAERVANIYVEHPDIKRTWDILDSIREHHSMGGKNNTPRNLFIPGKSGVGKTQLVKRYAYNNPGYVITDEKGTEIDIKPVVYFEVPEPFTILEFYQSIVTALGAPNLLGRPTIGEVKRQAFTLLKKQRTEMLILDEIDYISESKYVSLKEAMETLKHVSNLADVSIVCVGSTDIQKFLKEKFQYFRRFPKVDLKCFAECDDEFCDFLKSVEDQIKPPYPIGLGNKEKELPQLLFGMCQGFVGTLTPIIQEAYRQLGVFDKDFNDLEELHITVDRLLSAYDMIVGDLDETEFKKMVAR